MADIFISYASVDRPRVKPLVEALKQRGWSVWWDRTILAGKTFDRVIEAALKDSRCVMVLWSKDSVESDWVWTEADEGKRRRILVPAVLDDIVIPFAFRRIQTANLVGWAGTLPSDQFDKLAGAVSDVLSSGTVGSAATPDHKSEPHIQELSKQDQENRPKLARRKQVKQQLSQQRTEQEQAEQERLKRKKRAGVRAKRARLGVESQTRLSVDQKVKAHLATLKEGVEAWNAWRTVSPGTHPDLSGVNLRGANLEGFNLVGTDLRGSDLTGANLRGVDVSGAIVGGTTFQNVDLSSVTGLEDVTHSGQSAVSLSTYYRSHGKIPESFLRGCRVPDEYISYMRSHVVNPDDVPVDVCTCFISYSNKDAAFAVLVHAELKKRALNPWLDLEDLKIGDRFQERIEESIVHCTKLLVVLSTDSVNSRWVEREVQAAFEKERRQSTTVLLPVRLDDAVMESPQAWAAEIRRTRHIGDFREWKNRDSFQKSLDRLIRDLKAQNSNPK